MAINKRVNSRTSKIWTTPSQSLQSILNQSKTYKQVFQKIGIFSSHCGSAYHNRLRQRIQQDKLDSSVFLLNRQNYMKSENLLKARTTNKISDQFVFCENSNIDRNGLKRRIIKDNLIPYKCACCPVQRQYNGKPISLQLDHINGTNNDNRLQNLRFLCPNCHSQTDTYAGKSLKIKKYCQCGKLMSKKSIECRICSNKDNKFKIYIHERKFNPTKQQLKLKLIQLNWSWEDTGRFYGVNGNSIKKRCKLLNISSPYKNKPKNMSFNPTKQQLQKKIIQTNYNLSAVGRFYDIDDAIVKKMCAYLNIQIKDLSFKISRQQLQLDLSQFDMNKTKIGAKYNVHRDIIADRCNKYGLKHSKR